MTTWRSRDRTANWSDTPNRRPLGSSIIVSDVCASPRMDSSAADPREASLWVQCCYHWSAAWYGLPKCRAGRLSTRFTGCSTTGIIRRALAERWWARCTSCADALYALQQAIAKPEIQLGCWRLAGHSGASLRGCGVAREASAVARSAFRSGSERLASGSEALGADPDCGLPYEPGARR